MANRAQCLSMFFIVLFTIAMGARPVLADSCRIDPMKPLSSASVYDNEGQTTGVSCADYFRKRARILLGKEKRLPNGISWRLQTDTASGTSLPRLTWMPSARSLKAANDALDVLHGSLALEAAAASEELMLTNRDRRSWGSPLLPENNPLVQFGIDVTYATNTLISLVDIGYWVDEGNSSLTHLQGLTIDLGRDRLYHKASCPKELPPADPTKSEAFGFRFGDLLRVCDQDTYLKFVHLLRRSAEKAAERVPVGERDIVEKCIEHYRLPPPGGGEDRKEEITAIYLTFKGLAVHSEFDNFSNAQNHNCMSERTAINPVIIPYQELKPFMRPGPWRDELLALR